MSILGTRVLRTEDPLFLTRGGLYTDDVEDERLTGALHVTFVRSPLAQAAARADEGTSPPTDMHASNDYRRHLAQVLTARALLGARGRA